MMAGTPRCTWRPEQRLLVYLTGYHPESVAVRNEVEFYERNGMPFRTLRDGEALVVDGMRSEVVG